MRTIPLTQSKVAIVDDEDYDDLSRTEVEAAIAYDRAAVKYFGGFACPNFPPNKERTNP